MTIFERPDALSGEDCDRIVALAAGLEQVAGGVLGAGGYAPNPAIRDVRTTFVGREDAGWLFDRLDAMFAEASGALGIAVGPLRESVQLVRYDVGGHFNHWHSDAGADLIDARRLSASVELSEIDAYEGGLLEIVPDRMGLPRSVARGGAVVFPSRALHRVTPVSRGTRLALVAWTGL